MDNKLTETGSSNRRVAAVPIWVKPYLTIEEAAEYTGIAYLTESKGGTAYTVNYAKQKKIQVINLAEREPYNLL